ncbi:diguanylate cyclase [Rhizobium sp. BK251]|uniref:diguanylate cyclase domain-containing protein n=1 Tax=Rhizobium sp. BK251 TaxID=2512125 RepID=UPI001049C4AD|nr:diguanylate cyclase [Rhizobium sp. BK251]TCL70339.1 diguanylate cyclase [Rhizobium sp. BK251]
MVSVNPTPNQNAQQSRRELYYNVFATLTRLQIDASPVNYELMYEIISGNNPELREKFARLGKNITEEDLDALARTYLPHHFGGSVFDRSTNLIQNELTTLKESLQSGQNSLTSYTNMLGQASGHISSIDPSDPKKIQSQLQAIQQATEMQRSKSSQMLETVSTQISAVAAIASDVDEFEKMKFTHAATGLGNRRAFNKKIAELYMGERYPEASLLFCNLVGLEPFEKREFLQLKESILQRIGSIASHVIQATDSAAWLDRPQVGIIVLTSAEAEIRRIADQIRNGCRTAFGAPRPGTPVVMPRFGCCTTFDANNASDLIRNAEKALETAIDAADEKVAFFAAKDAGGGRKDWSIYRA